MLPAEAERLLTPDLVEWLADLVDPALLRKESPKAQLQGLTSAVVHRVGVNETFGLLHFREELEHNPLPLRDPDGLRLVLVTSRGEDLAVDDVEFVDWSRDDDCQRCRTALESWTPPAFDRSARITSVGALHIAYDNAGRAGIRSAELLARLRPAVARANADLDSWDSETVGAYWHPTTESWAHVVPLALDPERGPVAGVLTRHPDGYHLVTILTRRTAFWNVASVGQVPPAWLDHAGGTETQSSGS
ncbi:hypothetical protein J2S40_001434 [Nocardioides luteus]|uniref:Uncharacterized protein n=1 Tax=Nocardioides luteus TaxID=1844 RepID=A0ABQ5T0P2_9ACTN|nr:hypothetical protein [Nocardioides luteus]MDR7310376.1 hypothetical protein [Nocardioides luteus]GGR53171.1 hypothetical protein GCM10010197_19290 [Nocardioides luteus]GLJ69845.1 hypothetical protein GCM10017579_38810 [Nocardioides luteus]